MNYFQVPETVRFIYGPLPEPICYLKQVLRSSYFVEIMLLFDAMAIAQFIYIFYLKNPMAFDDKFWCQYVSIFIKIFSLVSQWVWHTLTPRQPINYFICTGFDPTHYTNSSFIIYGFFEILTILIQMFVYYKINQYKLKGNSLNTNSYEMRKKVNFNLEKNSIPSFITNIINVTALTITTLFMVFITKMDPWKLNDFPYSFMVQFVCMCLICILAFSSTASYYIKHQSLRKTLINCITRKKPIDIIEWIKSWWLSVNCKKSMRITINKNTEYENDDVFISNQSWDQVTIHSLRPVLSILHFRNFSKQSTTQRRFWKTIKWQNKMTWCLLWSVWPDGYSICSIFGHLEHFKYTQ